MVPPSPYTSDENVLVMVIHGSRGASFLSFPPLKINGILIFLHACCRGVCVRCSGIVGIKDWLALIEMRIGDTSIIYEDRSRNRVIVQHLAALL